MAGTKQGGKIAAETNKREYGDDFYKRIGSKGGKKGTGHAFGHGKVDPSTAGKSGGRSSSRTFTAKQRKAMSDKMLATYAKKRGEMKHELQYEEFKKAPAKPTRTTWFRFHRVFHTLSPLHRKTVSKK